MIAGCDAFFAPLKPYIEDATRAAAVVSHTVITEHYARANDIAIPPHAEAAIALRLRNPQGLNLALALEGRGSEKASAELSANKLEVLVTISDPARLEVFDLTLHMTDNDRRMAPYDLPKMECRYLFADLETLMVTPGSLDFAFDPLATVYWVNVPYGTDSLSITAPVLSGVGASCAINGVPHNGLTPFIMSISPGMEIVITVIADSGLVKTYTLGVMMGTASSNAITNFSFPSLQAQGVIDDIANTIAVAVPYNTDLTNLTPFVAITGSSYSPLGPQDFSAPVAYTVTAWDGSVRIYTVTVTPVTVASIAIAAAPDKTEYAYGEALDLAGLLVTAAYSDGSTSQVPKDELQVSGFDPFIAGTQTLTVSYGGAIATFTVMVKQDSIFSISFSNIDEGPSIIESGIILYKASNGGPTSATVTVDNHTQYTSIRWIEPNAGALPPWMDDIEQDKSVELFADKFLLGKHTITVIVVKNGLLYSTAISFIVEY